MSHINSSIIEWHPRLAGTKSREILSNKLREGLQAIVKLTKSLEILDIDDETYAFAKFPLPKC